ncbi:hypothetical protein KGM_205022 [Danaus plexippus plexippus]|nr:hypothetical protein KGM_205022 [Danaus plexippus plexippus]
MQHFKLPEMLALNDTLKADEDAT